MSATSTKEEEKSDGRRARLPVSSGCLPREIVCLCVVLDRGGHVVLYQIFRVRVEFDFLIDIKETLKGYCLRPS